MREFNLALVIGVVFGLVVGATAGWYFSPVARSWGISADTLASFLGSAFGAIFTIMGVFAVEEFRHFRRVQPHALLIQAFANDVWNAACRIDTAITEAKVIDRIVAEKAWNVLKDRIGRCDEYFRTTCLQVPRSLYPMKHLGISFDFGKDAVEAFINRECSSVAGLYPFAAHPLDERAAAAIKQILTCTEALQASLKRWV